MTLADDLRAAKALIDTPEKFEALKRSTPRSIYEACYRAVGDEASADKAFRALAVKWLPGDSHFHDTTMDMFDRAIAAAEQSEAVS